MTFSKEEALPPIPRWKEGGQSGQSVWVNPPHARLKASDCRGSSGGLAGGSGPEGPRSWSAARGSAPCLRKCGRGESGPGGEEGKTWEVATR